MPPCKVLCRLDAESSFHCLLFVKVARFLGRWTVMVAASAVQSAFYGAARHIRLSKRHRPVPSSARALARWPINHCDSAVCTQSSALFAQRIVRNTLIISRIPATQYTHPIHLPNTPTQYTYPIHLPDTPTRYTHPIHLPDTPTQYTNPIHQPNTPTLNKTGGKRAAHKQHHPAVASNTARRRTRTVAATGTAAKRIGRSDVWDSGLFFVPSQG